MKQPINEENLNKKFSKIVAKLDKEFNKLTLNEKPIVKLALINYIRTK